MNLIKLYRFSDDYVYSQYSRRIDDLLVTRALIFPSGLANDGASSRHFDRIPYEQLIHKMLVLYTWCPLVCEFLYRIL